MDLDTMRKVLLGDFGVRLTLSHVLEESAAKRGLLPVAIASLNEAVQCLACDLPAEARALAHQAKRFLLASLATQEKPNRNAPGIDEARRLVYLSLTTVFLPSEAAILPSLEVVNHLRQAKCMNGFRLFFVIVGAREELLLAKELASPRPLQIRHPDKFAYFLATSPADAQREAAIESFLLRYARTCLGLTAGLGTPVDFLTAVYAACIAQGQTPGAARIISTLKALPKLAKAPEPTAPSSRG